MDGDLALRNRHLDHSKRPRAEVWITRYGGLESKFFCGGCLPKDATNGHLCADDHRHLVDWLHSLVWLYGWLSANIEPSTSAAPRPNWQRPGKVTGSPAPGRVSVMDLRQLLLDRVEEVEGIMRYELRQEGTSKSLSASCSFIYTWLERLEQHEDEGLVLHVYGLFEDLIRRARMVAPWEARPRKIKGIACPNCGNRALEIKPGEVDVTCKRCPSRMTREVYDRWTALLAYEASSTVKEPVDATASR